MTATKTRQGGLTADDLLGLYAQGVRGELIRGVLCETMLTGIRHGKIVMNLGYQLMSFIEPRRLGTLVGSDAGVLLEREPDTVREPDIAFFSAARLPLDIDVPGYSEVVPELVVEVVSPSDGRWDVYHKARMWLSFGVLAVWVVDPDTRAVDIHRMDTPVSTLTADDDLDGGDILPGFMLPVREVFDL